MPPDEFDQASEFEQLRRDIALQQRRPVGPLATGACHFCTAPLNAGHRWCDSDCRDDWEREQRALRMMPCE